ncbi:hypothetical protein [Qipengyuania aurantiaca]
MVEAFFDHRSHPLLLAAKGIRSGKSHKPRLVRAIESYERAILSEENFIGSSHESFGGKLLYPNASFRLAKLRRALPERPIRIWLCIRNQAHFLASAYAESLRHGNATSIEDLRQLVQSGKHSWYELIQRMQKIMSDTDFVIWRYEDFRTLQYTILAELTGLSAGRLQFPQTIDSRPSASAEAVFAQNQRLTLNPQFRAFEMLKNEAIYPKSRFSEAFAPWSEETVRELNGRYDGDLAAIAELPHTRILNPMVGD